MACDLHPFFSSSHQRVRPSAPPLWTRLWASRRNKTQNDRPWWICVRIPCSPLNFASQINQSNKIYFKKKPDLAANVQLEGSLLCFPTCQRCADSRCPSWLWWWTKGSSGGDSARGTLSPFPTDVKGHVLLKAADIWSSLHVPSQEIQTRQTVLKWAITVMILSWNGNTGSPFLLCIAYFWAKNTGKESEK